MVSTYEVYQGGIIYGGKVMHTILGSCEPLNMATVNYTEREYRSMGNRESLDRAAVNARRNTLGSRQPFIWQP